MSPFDIKRDDYGDGWTVYDTGTGVPAVVNGFEQTGLALAEADDLADLLNHRSLTPPAKPN